MSVENATNKAIRIFHSGFHRHIRGGAGTKYVKNHSHRFEEFVHDLATDLWKVFSLHNEIFARTYVKDTTDSPQTYPP